jgi:hypothetical protein
VLVVLELLGGLDRGRDIVVHGGSERQKRPVIIYDLDLNKCNPSSLCSNHFLSWRGDADYSIIDFQMSLVHSVEIQEQTGVRRIIYTHLVQTAGWRVCDIGVIGRSDITNASMPDPPLDLGINHI